MAQRRAWTRHRGPDSVDRMWTVAATLLLFAAGCGPGAMDGTPSCDAGCDCSPDAGASCDGVEGDGGGGLAGDGEAAACVGGERKLCRCDDGLRGYRSCTFEGRLAPCECPAPRDANPEPPAGDPGEVIAEPDDEAAFLFDGTLRTFELTLSPDDLAFLDAQPSAEQYVAGELRFDGQTYGPVGIRYKGSVGGFLQPCTEAVLGTSALPRSGKCSIKVSMNWQDPAATFFGLRKLQFHSMGRDPSMMRDRLGYAMFRQMGVPAPRAVHARLLINGTFAGIYALVEKVDGRFTRSRFTEGGKGNLYKEVWPLHDEAATYSAALETNEAQQPSVQHMLDFRLATLMGAEQVAAWLDTELTYRFLAVDRVLVNDDGIMHFWCARGGQGANPGNYGNHNYYWYAAADSSRLWLIPWDLDSSMGPGGFVQVHTDWLATPDNCACQTYPAQTFRAPQVPPACDPLIADLAENPDAFQAQVDAFLAGPFAMDAVEAQLVDWSTQIEASVQEQADAGIIASDAGVLTPELWQAALFDLRTKLLSMRQHRGYDYGASQ